jgi:hypothetical protein
MVGVAGGGMAGRFAGGGGCKAGEGIEEGGFALCGRRRKSGCVDRESWEFSTWVRIANLLIKLEDFHASASESEIVCWGLYVKTVRPGVMRGFCHTDAPGTILSIHANRRPSAGRAGAGSVESLHVVRSINDRRLIVGVGSVICRLGLKERSVCNA